MISDPLAQKLTGDDQLALIVSGYLGLRLVPSPDTQQVLPPFLDSDRSIFGKTR
jgi:hypothetical protein